MIPIYRKKAEKLIYSLRDELAALYPECEINFTRDLNADSASTVPLDLNHFSVYVGIADLFPVDSNGRPLTKEVSGIIYAEAVESMYHEIAHVKQFLYSDDPVMRLTNRVWEYNRDLYNDCYKSDIREIDAEHSAFQALHSHLCDTFGRKWGNCMFDDYARYAMRDTGSRRIVSLDKPYRRQQDVFDAFCSAYNEVLCHPYWYSHVRRYDRGVDSGDMVLRVLANQKWDGAAEIIGQQSAYVQSCRKVLALCAQEDPSVLRGLEDMGISLCSEFSADFLEQVQQRGKSGVHCFTNEYERMRSGVPRSVCCGHPTLKCRLAIEDAGPSESGDFMLVHMFQACDLVGDNCPVAIRPDLVSIELKKQGGRLVRHYARYSKEEYAAITCIMNVDGDMPVFYGNLVPYTVQNGLTHFKVDTKTLVPSKIPFRILPHNRHVEEAKRDMQMDTSLSKQVVPVVHRPYIPSLDLPILEPEFGSPDSKDDFGPSL